MGSAAEITSKGGDDDDGHSRQSLVLAKLFEYLPAVHRRHHQIEEDQRRRTMLTQPFQRLLAVAGTGRRVFLELERANASASRIDSSSSMMNTTPSPSTSPAITSLSLSERPMAI